MTERKAGRLEELTRLGQVEERTFPVLPASFGWPACCVCGCVTPQATATAGLAPGEWLCPDCASELKGWAARQIMRAALAREEAERQRNAERMEEANRCRCEEMFPARCESCQAWDEVQAAAYTASRRV